MLCPYPTELGIRINRESELSQPDLRLGEMCDGRVRESPMACQETGAGIGRIVSENRMAYED